MSKELRIMISIVDVLKVINGEGNYNFDVGERVYRGRQLFDDDDHYPIISVEDSGSAAVSEKAIFGRDKIDKRVVIHGLLDVADINNPNDEAYLFMDDIKRAVFSGDERLNGDAITITYTGSAVSAQEDQVRKIGCRVDLTVSYAENHLEP